MCQTCAGQRKEEQMQTLSGFTFNFLLALLGAKRSRDPKMQAPVSPARLGPITPQWAAQAYTGHMGTCPDV